MIDKTRLDDYLHAAAQPVSNAGLQRFVRAWWVLNSEERGWVAADYEARRTGAKWGTGATWQTLEAEAAGTPEPPAG